MAYLGNGIYDLLDVIKASKDPSIAYEGLYQDPRRYDTTYYGGDLKTYPYGMTDASGAQALISSAFPQEYGVGSLFNPRVGRPEQSIYYKYQPDFINAPQDDYASLYSTQPDFINAPQDDYASLYSLPELDTSRFKGMDLESGYLDRAGSSDQDVYSEKPKSFRDSKTLEEYFQNRSPLQSILQYLPTPFNIVRNILSGEGIRSLNQRLRNTDFGQSKTLQEYMSRRKERDAIERAQAAAPSVYQSAKDQDFTGPRGGFSTTGRYNESAFSSTKSSRGRQDF